MGGTGNTRREMLAGLGAVGAGLAGLGLSAQAAGAAGGDPAGPTVDGGPALDVGEVFTQAAPVTAGTRYLNIAGIDLYSGDSAQTYTSNLGEVSSTATGFFVATLTLPPGAKITELVTYFVKNAASNITLRIIRSDGSPEGAIFETILSTTTATAPVLPTPQTLISPVPDAPAVVVNPAEASHFFIANLPATANVQLRGIRVGYTSDRTSFVPLTPGRVYDSRWPIFGGAKILSGEDRVIAVRDRRRIAPDDGVIDLADFVPAGAAAIALNLTVTDTLNGGFLSVTPGTATSFGAASINWSATNQILNNGTVAAIDVNRQVRVFAGGGGAAHFIIDVTGYYI
jgi:hypothetical protein